MLFFWVGVMSKASIFTFIEAGSFRKRFTQLVLFLRFGFRGCCIVLGISDIFSLHYKYTLFLIHQILPFGDLAVMGNPPQRVQIKLKPKKIGGRVTGQRYYYFANNQILLFGLVIAPIH